MLGSEEVHVSAGLHDHELSFTSRPSLSLCVKFTVCGADSLICRTGLFISKLSHFRYLYLVIQAQKTTEHSLTHFMKRLIWNAVCSISIWIVLLLCASCLFDLFYVHFDSVEVDVEDISPSRLFLPAHHATQALHDRHGSLRESQYFFNALGFAFCHSIRLDLGYGIP